MSPFIVCGVLCWLLYWVQLPFSVIIHTSFLCKWLLQQLCNSSPEELLGWFYGSKDPIAFPLLVYSGHSYTSLVVDTMETRWGHTELLHLLGLGEFLKKLQPLQFSSYRFAMHASMWVRTSEMSIYVAHIFIIFIPVWDHNYSLSQEGCAECRKNFLMHHQTFSGTKNIYKIWFHI